MNIKQELEYERYRTTYAALERWYEKQKQQRIQRAIAEKHSKTLLYGKVKAIASNMFAQHIELVICPIGIKNSNGQGVPLEEKENVLFSSVNMPIKANFTGTNLLGHLHAETCGVITETFDKENIITARGILWADQHQDLIDYIREEQEVYGSWEIWYGRAEIRDGTEWLRDITLSGYALVGNPSYGTKTPARLA